MNYWAIIYRFAWFLLLILFAVGLTCLFVPKFNRIDKLQNEKAALQEDVRRLESLTADLRRRQEKFSTDPQFVERIGREMGMVKPGEIIFKFTNAGDTANQVVSMP